MFRAALKALAAMALAAGAVVALPSAASAEADFYMYCDRSDYHCQNGDRTGSGFSSDRCATAGSAVGSTRVCVEHNGDRVYVRDGKSDGDSAIAVIEHVYLGTTRICRNAHGYGTWAACNFDWAESRSANVYGGKRISNSNIQYQDLWTWTP